MPLKVYICIYKCVCVCVWYLNILVALKVATASGQVRFCVYMVEHWNLMQVLRLGLLAFLIMFTAFTVVHVPIPIPVAIASSLSVLVITRNWRFCAYAATI